MKTMWESGTGVRKGKKEGRGARERTEAGGKERSGQHHARLNSGQKSTRQAMNTTLMLKMRFTIKNIY